MRTRAVLFEKAQRGWRCSLTFTHATVNQFTDETELAVGLARYWWWAYVRARREARRLHRELGAKPGERAALGWAD